MKRSNIILLSVVGLFAMVFFWGCGKYNSIIDADEAVNQAFGNMQAQYQRRADLLPNIIRIAEEAGKNEKGILETVTNARAGITSVKKEFDGASTPEQLEQINTKVSKINSAFTLAMEAYPQIKSNENYLRAMDDFSGTENRIANSREKYNEAIQKYNISIRRFPGNIVANFGGFTTKKEFKAEAGTEKAPDYDKAWDKVK
jgi:LemA protein